MEIMNWKNTLMLSGPVLCGIALKLMKNRKRFNDSINEVLFYGGENEERTTEIGLNNLFCISHVVAHASRTIDVCVPSLESETMAKCLVTAQQRNKAKIRIAIHSSDHFGNLMTFGKHGIEVKVIKSVVKLEHEFILIDAGAGVKDALALIGALDYEASRVNCNRESTMLTSESNVLINLQREFDRIWNLTPDVIRIKDDKTT